MPPPQHSFVRRIVNPASGRPTALLFDLSRHVIDRPLRDRDGSRQQEAAILGVLLTRHKNVFTGGPAQTIFGITGEMSDAVSLVHEQIGVGGFCGQRIQRLLVAIDVEDIG